MGIRITYFVHGTTTDNENNVCTGWNIDNHQSKHIAIVAHRAPQLALDVLTKGKTWDQAIVEDWRKKKAWQPGWEYFI